MKRLKRVLFLILALVFLFESWLWDTTGSVIEKLITKLPLQPLKHWVAERVSALNPWATLFVFIIPAVVLFPLKLLAMWLMTKGQVLLGLGLVIIAKCIGFGVSSFLFHVCKPQLLQLSWVRIVYHALVRWKELATAYLAPYTRKACTIIDEIKKKMPRGRVLRLIKKWRKKIKN